MLNRVTGQGIQEAAVMNHGFSRKIAVIGSGISGLSAAYILQRTHAVTIFEKNDYIGGHTHTVQAEDSAGRKIPVDTGFIVMNHRNYPVLTRFFEHLHVPLVNSDMSFGYWNESTGLQYSGSNLSGLFAQRSNLVNPSFLRFTADVIRFFKAARHDLEAGTLGNMTLGAYLASGRYGDMFVHEHILPMGAAIWSTPQDRIADFPAESFLRFFQNHGLLELTHRPQWRSVEGGSQVYVKKVLESFRGNIRMNCPVNQVFRNDKGIRIILADGSDREFDTVVIACHADEALLLLGDPDETEASLLRPWKYEPNITVLHTSPEVLPPLERARASWNYTMEQGDTDRFKTSLTYHMNRLQKLETDTDFFVTLNRRKPISPNHVISSLTYTHPSYTFDALKTQSSLPDLNGRRNTFFCGSYFGYGFHEDGIRSGVQVANAFGMDL